MNRNNDYAVLWAINYSKDIDKAQHIDYNIREENS